MEKARETSHITQLLHILRSTEIPLKIKHIGTLVFLKVNMYNMNLFLAFIFFCFFFLFFAN